MIIDFAEFAQAFGPGLPRKTDLGKLVYGSIEDRRVILALARTVEPEIVVEFGIQEGMTARMLLDEVTSIARYVGIDLPPAEDPALPKQRREKPAEPGRLVANDKRVEIILARSETLGKDDLPPADLIYIDGGHDFETVMHDSLLARAIARPGGVILWHDYKSEPGVRRAVDMLNRTTGDRIWWVRPTWVCFERISA